ncbi:MAG: ATP-binding protein [Candidatus Brocadiaceae bacterium]|nr:ATP-binding protein [Candidatus Brocadiaceae bacterium]
MSLGTLNFDDISEGDLKELIDNGVPEGLKIDYKRDFYGASDNDKKEALKDVSSFANSFGGHLIIGMDENGGIPTEITGLHRINADTEIQRLENLVRDGLEPRITGLKIKAILLKSGNSVILIRIPKSWNPPHRVSARNFNRFYVRNSAGAHEVSVEELRSLFNLSASVHDRIQSFRRERLAILSADEGPMKIGHGGRLILHIVPLSAFGYGQSLDVKQIYNHALTFPPLSSSGNSRYNLEGVIVYRGDEKCSGYTQIFRNGIIEATKAEIVREQDGRKLIASLSFDKDIFEVLFCFRRKWNFSN